MHSADKPLTVGAVPRDWARIGLYLVAATMAYNIIEAVVGILAGVAAESIALATLSLVIMPLVAWGKLRAAREIGSNALRAEAKETLACAYLSFTLLLGLSGKRNDGLVVGRSNRRHAHGALADQGGARSSP